MLLKMLSQIQNDILLAFATFENETISFTYNSTTLYDIPCHSERTLLFTSSYHPPRHQAC